MEEGSGRFVARLLTVRSLQADENQGEASTRELVEASGGPASELCVD